MKANNEDQEITQQTIRMTKGLLRRVRVYCAKNDIKQNDFFLSSLAEYLKKHDKENEPA